MNDRRPRVTSAAATQSVRERSFGFPNRAQDTHMVNFFPLLVRQTLARQPASGQSATADDPAWRKRERASAPRFAPARTELNDFDENILGAANEGIAVSRCCGRRPLNERDALGVEF